MARLAEIVIDSAHPAALARFWAAALDGYSVRAYDEREVARLARLGFTPETDPSVMVDGTGPTMCVQQCERNKTARSPIHFDIVGAARNVEVARLVSLGAQVREVRETFTVMLDPEGNVFACGSRNSRQSQRAPWAATTGFAMSRPNRAGCLARGRLAPDLRSRSATGPFAPGSSSRAPVNVLACFARRTPKFPSASPGPERSDAQRISAVRLARRSVRRRLAPRSQDLRAQVWRVRSRRGSGAHLAPRPGHRPDRNGVR
jgi:hypothetical protein